MSKSLPHDCTRISDIWEDLGLLSYLSTQLFVRKYPSFHWTPDCTLQSMCIRESQWHVAPNIHKTKTISACLGQHLGVKIAMQKLHNNKFSSFTPFPWVPCYCLATGCHHHRCRCHCHNEDSNLGIRVTWKHTSKTEPQGQATIPAAPGWPSIP